MNETKTKREDRPVIFLIMAAIMCWLSGLMCVSVGLRFFKIVAPEQATVPIALYKQALQNVNSLTFVTIPTMGAGYLFAAACISFYLFKSYRLEQREKTKSDGESSSMR